MLKESAGYPFGVKEPIEAVAQRVRADNVRSERRRGNASSYERSVRTEKWRGGKGRKRNKRRGREIIKEKEKNIFTIFFSFKDSLNLWIYFLWVYTYVKYIYYTHTYGDLFDLYIYIYIGSFLIKSYLKNKQNKNKKKCQLFGYKDFIVLLIIYLS